MAYKFTYEDFDKAAREAGLLDRFSAADLKLARSNPDAGMSILNYKKDYMNATTDEARALANQGAERIRSGYGEYTGGTDGSKFYQNSMSPGSFQDSQRYLDALDAVTNFGAFEYDAETDPLYSQYRKQYSREGQRATADALGQAAAASGGLPSSYAQTAAGQAANYYAAQMTDKIPELYQIAYNKYLNDFNQANTKLDAARTDNQQLYTRYLDEIDSQDLDRQRQLEFAQLGAQYGDYSHLGDLGIDYDRSAEELEKLLQAAQLGKSYGNDTAYRKYMETLGLPVPEKSATGTYYGGGTGKGTDDAEDAAESTLYQTLFQSGIRSEAEAYEWLIRNGYNATQAGKLAGYFGGLVDDGAFETGKTAKTGGTPQFVPGVSDSPLWEQQERKIAGTLEGTGTGKMTNDAALSFVRSRSRSVTDQVSYLEMMRQNGQITAKQFDDLAGALLAGK